MSASPFDHPFLSGLLGDAEASSLFTAEADMRAMLAFESALAQAEAEAGLIGRDAADCITTICQSFAPDYEALKLATGKDGVVVPELVNQLRKAVGKKHAPSVHFGATSQDVIDTSLILRLKTLSRILDTRLEAVISALSHLDKKHGAKALMGRTRMQPAIPIKVTDRIDAWRDPLIRHRERLIIQSQALFIVQLGGAAGTLDRLGSKAVTVRTNLARTLKLGDAPQWHSQRDRLAEFSSLLSLITGTLGKFGADIALLAQLGEIVLDGGGASSAMSHKQNPVAAELLVTLARFNAVQLSGMHLALVHEQERSGSAWSLEWMLLPQMAIATAASLNLALSMCSNIKSIGRSGSDAH
ncbi:3-carboxy-cis,cis-muconate cycloisomerase [Phyllobacterium sp. YR531]|uniref:3-carboxy-cis,cis-muconate cycloisomerase n=1 Tax=Phyllobacterium sp. YR531 TaxID=1144343 RepID=UPI00026F49FD|nr:3-carboxy-cis,cis-muconate cycloisomerase [Phyllobacterium sp. YR531]EJM99509.1 3-carboxy-cis,cis-muconate cycloisomerase [Phyllobacterium sp. YR531]